jgi:hypothetical protein
MNNTGRIALIVTGAVAALVSTALIVGGIAALWGDSHKDSDGYLTTKSQRFEAGGRALATENLDMDLGDADWVAQTDDLGRLKITAESRDQKPLFVGLARTSDVESYLSGVPYSTVTDVDASPFRADYERHAGNRHPVSPEHAGIWEASSDGRGEQSIDWQIEDGDWSIVVMNADGSPGVQADISAGAKLPYLTEIGWSSLGGGAILLLTAATLVVFAVRPPRNRSPKTQATGLAPSAG